MSYFNEEELWSPDTKLVKLNDGFYDALIALREAYGKPMIVNSCCRSMKHNQYVRGSSRSFHLYEGVDDGRTGALAIDIRVSNGKNRWLLEKLAKENGWSHGSYKNFIHLDRRSDLGYNPVSFWGAY